MELIVRRLYFVRNKIALEYVSNVYVAYMDTSPLLSRVFNGVENRFISLEVRRHADNCTSAN